jgi:hypothetical protein
MKLGSEERVRWSLGVGLRSASVSMLFEAVGLAVGVSGPGCPRRRIAARILAGAGLPQGHCQASFGLRLRLRLREPLNPCGGISPYRSTDEGVPR